MDDSLLRLIAGLCAVPGLGMLLFPRSCGRLEEVLNREWGGRPVLELRAGLPGERRAEEFLNAPILPQSVVWDDLLRRNPRATGLGLCLTAALLWLAA